MHGVAFFFVEAMKRQVLSGGGETTVLSDGGPRRPHKVPGAPQECQREAPGDPRTPQEARNYPLAIP